LDKEIAENEEALKTATAMREKEQGEFLGSEKEMIQAIRSLDAAVTVLSKHNGGGKKAAFLAKPGVINAYSVAKELMDKHYDVLATVITPTERKVLSSFMQAPKEDYFDAEPTFNQAYAPQSSQIFGILSQMKETFENNLKQEQKEEMNAQEAFKSVKEGKEAEIKVAQDSVDQKSEQLAKADEIVADSKDDHEDTTNTWSADKKFLMEVKVKCKMTDIAWEKRSVIRNNEIEAVTKAIAILSSDEARDQFTKTLAQGSAVFLQTKKQSRRAQAVAVISMAAMKNPKLAALAVATRLDPFPKVKKAIDDMVAQLLVEKDAEIKEKDECTSNLNENEKDTAEEEHTHKKLETKIANLDQTIKDQSAAIDDLTQELSDLADQRAQASKDRKADNAAYLAEVAEQEKSQALLNNALEVLKKVYDGMGNFVQVRQAPAVGGAAPKGFDSYEKSRASGGVMAMIKSIVIDSQNMVKEATVDEQQSQDAFTKLVAANNESKAAKTDAKTTLENQKAAADVDRTESKQELKTSATELEALAATKGGLDKQCTFMLANFEITQKARDDEVDSLRSAKAFLNGMKKE